MTDPQKLFEALKAELGEAVTAVQGQGDDGILLSSPGALHGVLGQLKGKHGFNVLVDLTAVDRFLEEPRFELTYRLLSLDAAEGLVNGRTAVKIRLAEGEAAPRSVRDLWPAADWLEREVWDMFGVAFADRPGIKRLLMYEEFEGHPLRKDYPVAKRQPLVGPASGEPSRNPSFNAEVPTLTAD